MKNTIFMEALQQKKELIKWINDLEDISILEKIHDFNKSAGLSFEQRMEKGLKADELKSAMKRRIENYPKQNG